jgi:protein-S-isoprenylcysteine O-methyltransferase Ste14
MSELVIGLAANNRVYIGSSFFGEDNFGALPVRIFIEEAALRRGLPGYGEYAERVPYRLVPGVW